MRRCLNCMEEYPENYEACPHCGFIDGVTANGGINLPPGTILQGRYIVGTIIKTRETDVFYIGWDALFDRKVQIQEYFPRYCAARSGRPELSVYDSKKEPFEAGLEMFCGQSRQLIRLYKEEDVVTYHACFIENGTAYAIQEQQTYETLSDKLGGQTVRVKDAEKWLYEAAAAVEKAHQIGVCHGQIGLDAFWVRPGGGLILKDFGASRYISGEPGIVDHGRVGSGTPAAQDRFGGAVLPGLSGREAYRPGEPEEAGDGQVSAPAQMAPAIGGGAPDRGPDLYWPGSRRPGPLKVRPGKEPRGSRDGQGPQRDGKRRG